MPASSLWARLDPAADWRVTPSGIGDTSTDPARATSAASAPFYSPKHPQFTFGLVLLGTGLCLWYVWDHGAGAGAKANLGRASAGADVELEGSKK